MGNIKTLILAFSLGAFSGSAMAADAVIPPSKPTAVSKPVAVSPPQKPGTVAKKAEPKASCKLDKKTKKQVCRKSPYKPAFKPEPYKGKPKTVKP